MNNKQEEELKIWLCEYLARFNGGLDYHKLPDYRKKTYQDMADEISTHYEPRLLEMWTQGVRLAIEILRKHYCIVNEAAMFREIEEAAIKGVDTNGH